MRTAAILPVKRFADAKQRLGASVSAPLRESLARAMVADVLAAVARVAAIERAIVITREPAVVAEASACGALVLDDAAQAGQSAAVQIGIARALRDGYERALCIPGDCPALEPAELEALLGDAGAAHEVVIVPDRHGTGTNGLLLTPADVIAPGFGPDSCARHRRRAEAAGAPWRLARPPSLLLDVDTGEDLAALRARLAGPADSAARTRAVLAEREHELSLAASGA
ncbi:MAG TPA: 2-phospho-L-lactate guanylyltransferase [Solirubrobacteraceae bacterium]|nr:2-phospho-L-lactate guanylyltransferase [Solirubrobacteraceae bacterium]